MAAERPTDERLLAARRDGAREQVQAIHAGLGWEVEQAELRWRRAGEETGVHNLRELYAAGQYNALAIAFAGVEGFWRAHLDERARERRAEEAESLDGRVQIALDNEQRRDFFSQISKYRAPAWMTRTRAETAQAIARARRQPSTRPTRQPERDEREEVGDRAR